MIIIDIPDNPNCEPMDMRVFHDLDRPRPVHRVQVEGPDGQPAWFEVTGWTADNRATPALVSKVDDSGEGVALLVRGGEAGLRLRPVGTAASWALEHPDQWGAPLFILADEDDLELANAVREVR